MPVKQGDIVWAVRADPQGRNEKRRPFVVMTLSEEIREGETIVVAAITTTLPNPLTDEYVDIPWHRNGSALTRLRKRCAVHCGWIDELALDAVEQTRGRVSGGKLLEILQKVNDLWIRRNENSP